MIFMAEPSSPSIKEALERRHGSQPVSPRDGSLKDAEKAPPSGDGTPPQLIEQMEKVLGEYLCKIYGHDNLFIRYAGPHCITLVPNFDTGERRVKRFNSKVELKRPVWHSLLKRINPYLLETDVADVGEVVDLENLKILFPEYFLEGSKVTDVNVPGQNYNEDTDVKQKRAKVAHPYMIALLMPKDMRPIMTAVLVDALEDKKIEAPTELEYNQWGNHLLRQLPPLDSIGKTAQKYGIKTVVSILKKFHEVFATYKGTKP